MQVTLDVRGIARTVRRLSEIGRELHGRAVTAAINKTAEKARSEINRAIPDVYAVKADEVRRSIDLHRANSGSLKATIRIFGSKRKRGRSANLIHFLAVAQVAGVVVKLRGTKGATRKAIASLKGQLGFLIKKGGGIKKIPGAFVGNKGRTIFQRVGKSRLPIKPVQVIGFSQMFNSRTINDRVMAKIAVDFPVELDRAISYVLSRT